MVNTLIKDYTESIHHFNKEIAIQKKYIYRIFLSRILLFVGGLSAFIISFQHAPAIAVFIALAIIFLFLFLVKKELQRQAIIEFYENRAMLNRQEIMRLNNDLTTFETGKEFLTKEHPFISDLDIFGNRSIFQLLNRTCTHTGKLQLVTWLTSPLSEKKEIEAHQNAIACLSKKKEWSQQFLAYGLADKENKSDSEIIMNWLNEEKKFSSPFLKLSSILLPILTCIALVLQLGAIIGSGLFTVLFFTQLFIVMSKLKQTNSIHNQLSKKINSVEKYASLIKLVESENFSSPLLIELKEKLATYPVTAGTTIQQLKKIVNALDGRLNIIVAIMLNGLFLFDITIMIRLEKWKQQHKTDFLKWIEVLGEFDALISLGMHAYNNPDFVFPEVESESFILHAENTGHPLLSKSKLVKNTYSVEGNAHIAILTGANMAGKSTFLRTIGVNMVMAMMGLPVCADKFEFTPIRLFTSLRTNDSLQDNESFFYAELKRLQQLMIQYEQNESVFFLLDEILKGTNSKDQHNGAEALIKKIIQLNGTGIIATHDIELAKLSTAYPAQIKNLCFEIAIMNEQLSFDYKLKEGVCSTMNATFLMKKMGII